jgi:antitoxin (DNA-binding transcriptional repressor) of toxin-antitoxin stability system
MDGARAPNGMKGVRVDIRLKRITIIASINDLTVGTFKATKITIFSERNMRFVTVTELKQRATQIVSQIQASGEEIVITKNGKPVVLMRNVDEKEIVLMASMESKQGHGALNRG